MSDGISDGYRMQQEREDAREFYRYLLKIIKFKRPVSNNYKKLLELCRKGSCISYRINNEKVMEILKCKVKKLKDGDKSQWFKYLAVISECNDVSGTLYKEFKRSSPFFDKIVVGFYDNRWNDQVTAKLDTRKLMKAKSAKIIEKFEVDDMDNVVCMVFEGK